MEKFKLKYSTTKKIILLLFFSFHFLGFSQEKPKLNITIDERVETLYAIANFDNYFLLSKHNTANKIELNKKKYNQLKNAEAVKMFDTLSNKYNFNAYKPIEWILQYSNFPKFKKEKKIADTINIESIASDKKYLLKDFRNEILKFNQDSLFQKYLKTTKEINEETISKVKKSTTIDKLPQFLEEYYGTKLFSYNLILSPFLHDGGFNLELINDKGQKEVYAVVGPNGEIYFTPIFDKESIEMDLILHEFGHSFVNPLVDANYEKIEKLRSKFYGEKLQIVGKDEGYGDWKYVFDELLLRATTIKITEKYFGKESAKKLLENEKKVGFYLVEDFCKILDEYNLNRKKYKKFGDFFPIFLERLNNEKL